MRHQRIERQFAQRRQAFEAADCVKTSFEEDVHKDVRRDRANMTVVPWVAKMESSYVAIAKRRGFVYVYDNQLFRQMKKRESVIYLKRCTDPSDGLAKIENGELKVILSNRLFSGIIVK